MSRNLFCTAPKAAGRETVGESDEVIVGSPAQTEMCLGMS